MAYFAQLKAQQRAIAEEAYSHGFTKGAILGAVCTFLIMCAIVVFAAYVAVGANP